KLSCPNCLKTGGDFPAACPLRLGIRIAITFPRDAGVNGHRKSKFNITSVILRARRDLGQDSNAICEGTFSK
ncbi:MAG: hypothetical protein P8Z30_05785, partial [Acidobacteriota bacterium]